MDPFFGLALVIVFVLGAIALVAIVYKEPELVRVAIEALNAALRRKS